MSESDWLRLRCPSCSSSLRSSGTPLVCQGCGTAWPTDDGVVLFLKDSPESASYGIAPETYERLYRKENSGYFLYWVRLKVLESLLSHACHSLAGLKTLDIGCGTGYTLARLHELGADVVGVEPSLAALRFARKRGMQRLFRAGAQVLPFEDAQFDLVLSLDVYEHIGDDRSAMAEAYRVLASGGKHVVFVPAMKSLWSRCDEIQGHERRYNRVELNQKLTQAGFRVERVTHLLPSLFLPAYAVRTANKLFLSEERGRAAAWKEYTVPPKPLNSLLKMLVLCEAHVVTRCNFPFGITLAAVATRPG